MSRWHVEQIEHPEESEAWKQLFLHHPMARAIVPTWDLLAGWRHDVLGLYDGDTLVGGLLLAMQRVPLAAISLSRCNLIMIDPEGPVAPQVDVLLEGLERYALRNLVLETEMRLRLPVTAGVLDEARNRQIRRRLESFGYRVLRKVDTTYFVPLDKDDDALLASFDRSARNKIRKALRSGAKVEVSSDFQLLDDFYAAYLDMCERKSAPVQPEALVGRGLKPLIEGKRARLFIETYPEGVANMVIVDLLGVPCYVLGTRTRANVRGDVPGAAQVVQYEIMKQLRDEGHRWYDLGGCEGPVPVEGHHNYGVWRFKYGFQGEFVRFIPYMRKVRGPFQRAVHVAHVLRGDFV